MEPIEYSDNEYLIRLSVRDDEAAVHPDDIRTALYQGLGAIDTEDAIDVTRLS